MTKALDLSLAYKVADMALADFGKKEMQLSEREMPGLMECIRKYGDQKPLKGCAPSPHRGQRPCRRPPFCGAAQHTSSRRMER